MPLRPVNRIAHGFLDFLGLKSLGRNPDSVSEQYVPTLEIAEWMLRTNAETIRDFISKVAPFTPGADPFDPIPSMIVPGDEYWYVHAATLIVFGMTGAHYVAPGIMTVRNSAPTQYYEALLSTVMTENSGVTTASSSMSWGSRPRCWLPPLTQIGCSWHYLAGSSMAPGDVINLNVHLSITKVKA